MIEHIAIMGRFSLADKCSQQALGPLHLTLNPSHLG